MELTEEQAKRRQAFLDWNVESVLPETVGDYRFRCVDRQEGRIYYAFSYVNEATGWEVKALFDEETMDYMVKTDFRLFVMTDIEILTGNFEDYKKAVEALLVKNMRRELIERDQVSVVVRGRAFTAWDWHGGALPADDRAVPAPARAERLLHHRGVRVQGTGAGHRLFLQYVPQRILRGNERGKYPHHYPSV